MYLIVGLGNPGKEYAKTKHNVGFLAIDELVQQNKLPSLKMKKELQGMYVKTEINNIPIVLLQPQTYMNLSGESVQKVAHYFHIPVENIIVIHDDIDLPLGKIRITKNSSSGGQKGVQSIIQVFGKTFIRIKIGIAREEKRDAASYVLSPFNKEEWEVIRETLRSVPNIIAVLLKEGLEKAQNMFNE